MADQILLHPLSCQDLVELVTEYFEGALDPGEQQRFEAHMLECTHCRVYLAQMRETIRLVGRLEPEAIAPGARDELLAAFRGWKTGHSDLA